MPSLVATPTPPPSLAPNLHPPKRCKLEHQAAVSPTSTAPPSPFPLVVSGGGTGNGQAAPLSAGPSVVNGSISASGLQKPTSLPTTLLTTTKHHRINNHQLLSNNNNNSNGNLAAPGNNANNGFLAPLVSTQARHPHLNGHHRHHQMATPSVMSLPNSPCTESSTLQRNLVISKTGTIATDGLAARLKNGHKMATTTNNISTPNGSSSPNGGGVIKNGTNSPTVGGMGKNGFLVLDCRPFIAYNVSHILGAINVNCCDR